MTIESMKIGPHTLHLGDNETLLESPSLSLPDVMVMDPPYRFNTSGGGKFRAARPMLDKIQESKLDQGFNREWLSWKRAKSIFVFCHNDQLANTMIRLQQGFHRVVCCQWHKSAPTPVANKHYLPDTEFYLHAWQEDKHPLGAYEDKRRSINTKRFNHNYDHPTVKPPNVMDKIMTNANGATVLDPFMGTGSTGVSAHKSGKIFTGWEINPRYFEIAVKRMTACVEESKT